MPRKQRSDSITQKRLDAARPDTSILPVPSIPGDGTLGEVGRAFLEKLYRTEPEKFSVGDLHLLLEAASTWERITESRHLSVLTPPLITYSNGTIGRHPHFVNHEALVRQFQTLLRDAALRSRDGARSAIQSANAAPPETETADNVTSFNSWLEAQ